MQDASQQPQNAGTASVGFPQQAQKQKGKFPKWIIALLGALIILAIGAFLVIKVFKQSNEPIETPTPTPIVQGLSDISSPPADESTPSPEPNVDKSAVAVEVLNGTGVPGEAGFLKSELESLGYKKITAGNADTQSATSTTVTYGSSLPESLTDEFTTKLKSLYTDVVVKKSSSASSSISIVTGPRKNKSTAKPKATGSPSPSPTASAEPSSSPSPSPSQ